MAGLLACFASAALVAVSVHSGIGGQSTELVDPSLVDRFLADQAALDKTSSTAQGLQQIEDENLAEGDGLSAGMQQHATAGLGALTGVDDNTARALRAADGAIQDAGLQSGSGSLLGDLTGTQLESEMSDGGMPTADNNAHLGESLKQELDASRKELAAVAAGSSGAQYADKDMGLSESALNSVAEGMEAGLDAASVDPTTGLKTGQLELSPSSFAKTLAGREMRHVAGGTMDEGGTLTGLVGADASLSLDDGDDVEGDSSSSPEAEAAKPLTAKLHLDVEARTEELLRKQLKAREAAAARLVGGKPATSEKKRAGRAALMARNRATNPRTTQLIPDYTYKRGGQAGDDSSSTQKTPAGDYYGSYPPGSGGVHTGTYGAVLPRTVGLLKEQLKLKQQQLQRALRQRKRQLKKIRALTLKREVSKRGGSRVESRIGAGDETGVGHPLNKAGVITNSWA